MECFLCLELKQDIVDCIKMKSPTWDELRVESIIEKHLWAMIMFKSKSQWLCLTCWRILQEFHKFYKCIENAQINNECIIKKEFDSPSEGECNNQKPVNLVEPENVLDQTTIAFVKEEVEYYDNDYDDDIPLIHMRKCIDSSLGDATNDGENSIKNYFITTIKTHNDPTMAVITDHRQENEDAEHSVKSDPNVLKIPKDNERKSCLKYFYQSRISCRDFDKFITEYFNLICSNCEQSFDTFSELKTHFHEVHNKRGYVVCCDTTFYNRGVLVDHINCHLNPKYFKCEFCSKVLKLRKTYKAHMRSHDKNPYSCDTCNKKFQRKCYLEYHKQTHILTEDKKIPCIECNKLFASEYLLSNHLKLVHLKKYPKMCEICGQSMPNLEALKRHMQQHDGTEPSVSCNTCGLLVSSKQYLKIHMNLKHPVDGCQEHVCSICHKVSLTANALSHHIRRNHRTGYIHKCIMCEKAFKRLDHLKIHLNIHTGTDLYKCSSCPRSFRARSSLHSHRKSAHPKEFEEVRRKKYSGNLSSNDSPPPLSKDNEN